jgi:ketosteroid isomerase-like protein
MSQENLDALIRHYERWAVGDWTDSSVFDAHAVGVFPDPAPRAVCGLEALGRYWRSFLESWDDLRMEAVKYEEVGDGFLVWVHRSGTGSGSGVPIEDHVVHVWSFRGRRVIRLEIFESESDALEAVGRSD